MVKNNKAKIGGTAEKQHLIHTFSAIFHKSPNLHQIHSTTKFSGSKYIFCFSRYIFIDSGPPAKPESAGQCPQSNWNLSISCYGAGAPCLPLTREVPRRGGGRETSNKVLVFSLPQSASLTAPTSDGAFGVRCNCSINCNLTTAGTIPSGLGQLRQSLHRARTAHRGIPTNCNCAVSQLKCTKTVHKKSIFFY